MVLIRERGTTSDVNMSNPLNIINISLAPKTLRTICTQIGISRGDPIKVYG